MIDPKHPVAAALFAGVAAASYACGGGGSGDSGSGGATTLSVTASADVVVSSSSTTSSGTGGAGTMISDKPITDRHRFISGAMFGGWGPHLGHLARVKKGGGGTALWFVDDVCSQQPGPGACDVNHDHTLGYFERMPDGWTAREEVALPGTIQQNTATIVSASGDELQTFGVDVAGHTIIQCSYSPGKGPTGCAPLQFPLGAAANYIGAAISPKGYRLVWWTDVVDGGGGSFSYIVDYGGGWNGPRTGPAGGYNDASYINAAFGSGMHDGELLLHVQLVSGVAPNWTFYGATANGDLTSMNAVAFETQLAAINGDPVVSTNDVWIDPTSDDAHLVARTAAGAAAYFHRASGGTWEASSFQTQPALRARFVFSADRLVMIYGPKQGGLAYRIAEAKDRPAGKPIDWSSLKEKTIDLSAGFGSVEAIYPESPMYQTVPAEGIQVAIVGTAIENHVEHVSITP